VRGIGGDRTDARNHFWQCVASKSGDPIFHSRRRRERDDVGLSDARAFFIGGFNGDCSVRINNIDSPTKVTETIREYISRYFCSGQEHASLIGFAWQWKTITVTA
jgi:hypothetical protein